MVKKVNKSWFWAVVITLLCFIAYLKLYSPKPSYWLIVDYLQAKSLLLSGQMLNLGKFHLVSNVVGIPRLTLPVLILSPAIFLRLSSPSALIFTNFILITICGVILIKKVNFHGKLLGLGFLLLSPLIVQVITDSVRFPMLLLFFLLYIFSSKHKIKTIATIMGLLSSFYTIPLLFFIMIIELFSSKKKRLVLIRLAVLLFISFVLTKDIFDQVISIYFPALSSTTYAYFIDIHRQADVSMGVPWIGKIFYNKYVIISGQVTNNLFKYFDWDYLTFNSASGKFTSTPPTFAILSLFEIPVVIYFLYLGIKNKRNEILYLLVSILTLAISNVPNSLYLICWFLLFYLILSNWMTLASKTSKIVYIVAFLLIIPSRFILVNHAAVNSKDAFYYAYEELSEYIKSNNLEKPIYMTDRLGQPHIYLAYLGIIPFDSLRENLAITKRRDSKGLLQIDKSSDFVFTSFKYRSAKDFYKDNQVGTYIEFSDNFPLDEIKKDENMYKLKTEIVVSEQGKEKRTSLFLLQKRS